MDIMMPEMDGLTATREIRKRARAARAADHRAHRQGDARRPRAVPRRRAPTTTWPSRSTWTSWCRCAASGCRDDGRAVQAAPDDFDLEIELLLEAIYRQYSLRLPALRAGVAAPAHVLGARQLGSTACRCCSTASCAIRRSFTALLAHPDRAGERPVPRSGVLRGAPQQVCRCSRPIRRSRSGSPAAAPAKRCTRSRSCSTRRGSSSGRRSTPRTSIPRRCATAEPGVYRARPLAGLRATIRRRRRALALRLLHGGLRRRRVRPAAARQIVFSDHSLATDSVFAEVQLVTCRNVLIYFDATLQDARSGCSTTRWCRGASSASAQREPRGAARARFATLARRAHLPEAVLNDAPLERARRERSGAGRDRRLRRRRRRAEGAAAGAAAPASAPPWSSSCTCRADRPNGLRRCFPMSQLRVREAEDKVALSRERSTSRRPTIISWSSATARCRSPSTSPFISRGRPSTCCSSRPPTRAASGLLGILLSGANADGADGLAAIRAPRRADLGPDARVGRAGRDAGGRAGAARRTAVEPATWGARWPNGRTVADERLATSEPRRTSLPSRRPPAVDDVRRTSTRSRRCSTPGSRLLAARRRRRGARAAARARRRARADRRAACRAWTASSSPS